MGDPKGVTEWPVRAGDHDRLVVLQPWPVAIDALDEVDREQRIHRALDGDAADLPLAHRVVPVTDREQRARHVDTEVIVVPA